MANLPKHLHATPHHGKMRNAMVRFALSCLCLSCGWCRTYVRMYVYMYAYVCQFLCGVEGQDSPGRADRPGERAPR